MWWRPDAAGYTNNVDDAGRYSKEDAESLCAGAHGDDVPVDELAAYHDLKARRIVDMGDGGNRALLTHNVEVSGEGPQARSPLDCRVGRQGTTE